MKVYVYQTTKKNRLKFYQKEIADDFNLQLIGTIDLPIEPVKKEVVKEVYLGDHITGVTAYSVVNVDIPKEAYEVKLTYRVKE